MSEWFFDRAPHWLVIAVFLAAGGAAFALAQWLGIDL